MTFMVFMDPSTKPILSFNAFLKIYHAAAVHLITDSMLLFLEISF